MSLYVNNKQYTSTVTIDKGLSNVNIKNTDIRPGKISIDSNGNKLIAASNSEFLLDFTDDANILPEDVTENKTVYSNGVKIIGTAEIVNDYSQLIKGVKRLRAVSQGSAVSEGHFVHVLPDGNVTSYQGGSSIGGIALQSGQYGDTIEIIMPI